MRREAGGGVVQWVATGHGAHLSVAASDMTHYLHETKENIKMITTVFCRNRLGDHFSFYFSYTYFFPHNDY